MPYIYPEQAKKLRCPECREDITVPGPLARYSFYQCSSCLYLIELNPKVEAK